MSKINFYLFSICIFLTGLYIVNTKVDLKTVNKSISKTDLLSDTYKCKISEDILWSTESIFYSLTDCFGRDTLYRGEDTVFRILVHLEPENKLVTVIYFKPKN